MGLTSPHVVALRAQRSAFRVGGRLEVDGEVREKVLPGLDRGEEGRDQRQQLTQDPVFKVHFLLNEIPLGS